MVVTVKLTVQDVSDGPRPIDVLAAAQKEDITGKDENIQGVELRLILDEDETDLKVGDVITVSLEIGSASTERR